MATCFAARGIVHQTTCVYTPQQNGLVERKHRTFLNIARALRFHSSLPISFWEDCLLTTSHIINRTPSLLLNGVVTPTLSHLFPHIDSFVDRDPLFLFSDPSNSSSTTPTFTSADHPTLSVKLDTYAILVISPSLVLPPTSTSDTASLPRSTRVRQLPSKFYDYTGLPTHLCNHIHLNAHVTLPTYMVDLPFDASTVVLMSSSHKVSEPSTYKQAVKQSVWCEAMSVELVALEANHTWSIEPLPHESHSPWFLALSQALKAFVFVQMVSDASLFRVQQDNSVSYMMIYVDDMLLIGNNVKLLDEVIQFLTTQFKIKDLGFIHYFLGLELHRSIRGIFVNQHKYIMDIVKGCGLLDARVPCIPMDQYHTLLDDVTTPLFNDVTAYRRLVGRLIYMTITRPDLSYPIGLVALLLVCLSLVIVFYWGILLFPENFTNLTPIQLFCDNKSALSIA
ncbi:uncharacterized protein LOC141666036 [Apium graveolens]|uniref:uncharacterized protein LOC141666036 n=1 Tax=Apium graveolens TaxID=4045 RepID=UPI003D7A96AA